MEKKFTLIELLVVVAIIGILASLLLPSLSKARNASLRAVCASNEKQLGIALAVYHSSFDGFYPLHSDWGDMVGSVGSMSSYGGSNSKQDKPLNAFLDYATEVAKCPSDKGDSMNNNVKNAYESYGTSYLVQHASNSFAVESVTHDTAAFLKRVSEWQAPSKKIILGDWV
ncbi:MAG: DUF1559 domain-containing protein, partial [Lentisphaeraceae bacterium]|nr:DUF1559 domain-containing protein [Lentisphaeraceae bacterium]